MGCARRGYDRASPRGAIYPRHRRIQGARAIPLGPRRPRPAKRGPDATGVHRDAPGPAASRQASQRVALRRRHGPRRGALTSRRVQSGIRESAPDQGYHLALRAGYEFGERTDDARPRG